MVFGYGDTVEAPTSAQAKSNKELQAGNNVVDMEIFRTRNACVLAKLEVTETEDSIPDPNKDGILVENPKFTPSVNLIQTNEVSGSLDSSGRLVGGVKAEFSFDVLIKLSGKTGITPAFSSLLKACGYDEMINKAIQTKAEAAVSLVGNKLTLGNTAIDKDYKGLPVIVNASGRSDIAIILDYDKASKTITLNRSFEKQAKDTSYSYQIPASIIYKPHSGYVPSLTFYYYLDKVVYKIVGARGNMQLSLETGGVGKMSFNFNGMIASIEDASVPEVSYSNMGNPLIFKDSLLLIDSKKAAVHSLSIDMGNKLTHPDNPNAKEGFGAAIITERNFTGNIDPFKTLTATRNIMNDFLTGQARSITSVIGNKEGARIAITIPQAMYTARNIGDREGIATEEVQFDALGQDMGCLLTIF